jgi:hypothetical protein
MILVFFKGNFEVFECEYVVLRLYDLYTKINYIIFYAKICDFYGFT